MSKFIITGCFVFLAMCAVPVYAHEGHDHSTEATATTTTKSSTSANVADLLKTLQTLMARVEELKKQLAEVRGEIQAELKDGLAEGMTDEDIKEIQELLATDPTIYPTGLATGYFGPMTTAAIKRFQERHGLTVTGVIDAETKEVLKEYFKEKKDGRFPIGLLRAAEARERVKERMKERWGECSMRGEFRANLCEKMHDKKSDKTDEDDEDDESTATKEEVEEMITEAEEAIAELDALIDSAPSDVSTRAAKGSLALAERLLKSAKKALAEEEYEHALDAADEAAHKVAHGAIEKLQALIDDAE